MEGALHTSCTIEMANLFKRYDVAIIDEIQVSYPSSAHCLCLSKGPCVLLQNHPFNSL